MPKDPLLAGAFVTGLTSSFTASAFTSTALAGDPNPLAIGCAAGLADADPKELD